MIEAISDAKIRDGARTRASRYSFRPAQQQLGGAPAIKSAFARIDHMRQPAFTAAVLVSFLPSANADLPACRGLSLSISFAIAITANLSALSDVTAKRRIASCQARIVLSCQSTP
jgi:hypothetical protein